ncbi:Glycine--tRNA ligase beta subunit, partial [Bienertia sinuspersici]
RDYTYKRLTLEFLAALETNSTPSDPNDQFSNPNITMTFQMFNQQHSLSLDELNTIFGWPTDAEYGLMIGAITKDELRVIWLSLQDPIQYHALNNAAYLLDRFIAIASGEVFKSTILSGGMITIIVRALGHGANVDSDPRGPVDKDILLDLGAMRSMEFFQGNRAMRPPFKWLVRGKEWMMVPSPHTHIGSRDFLLPPNEFCRSKKTKRTIVDEQQQTTESVLGLRRDMDVLNRVAWRNHLANIYHGQAPGFPNHPVYAPYFPPPEGNDDNDY